MFEAEPEAYGFRQVGYVAAVPEAQVDDLVAIRGQHEAPGTSRSSSSARSACREYLAWTWPDWEAAGRRRCCTSAAAAGPTRCGPSATSPARARAAGAEIAEGVEVTGFELGDGGVEAVLTSRGRIRCEGVVVAPGPGRAASGACSASAPEVEVRRTASSRQPLIAYWKAQEGEFELPGRRPAGAPATSRRSSTSTRPGRCAPTATAGCWSTGPGGSTSAWARPARRSPAAACRCCWRTRSSTPTGPTTPHTPPSRASRSSSSRASATAFGRFRGRAGDWRTTLARRDRLPHPRQLPDLRLGRAQRLRDRRLGPRLQDARARPPGRRRRPRAASRALEPFRLAASSAVKPTSGLQGPVSVDVAASKWLSSKLPRHPAAISGDAGERQVTHRRPGSRRAARRAHPRARTTVVTG